jgi:DNA-directed RNA polymerase specialized sigma24 family protein
MDFHEYVYARGPALMRLACLLTGDAHRAEDLVQDVLASAYTKWHRISTADRPDVYMRRMLVNANISWLRESVDRAPRPTR